MAYQIHCPRCRLLMGVTGDDMGTECACPECATKFTVPPPAPQPTVLVPNWQKRFTSTAPTHSFAPAPKRKRKAPEGWLIGAAILAIFLVIMIVAMTQNDSSTGPQSRADQAFDFGAMMPPEDDQSPEANRQREQIAEFKAQWLAHLASQESLRKSSPRTSRIKIRRLR